MVHIYIQRLRMVTFAYKRPWFLEKYILYFGKKNSNFQNLEKLSNLPRFAFSHRSYLATFKKFGDFWYVLIL